MGDLSPHFNRNEFDCAHCGAGAPSPQLVMILENLRSISGGRPLRIVSGFRCKPHNAAVGGAPASRHINGDAADIPEGYATVDQAARAGAVGIGSKGRLGDPRRLATGWSGALVLLTIERRRLFLPVPQ